MNKIYYCENCRKIVDDVTELFFVEEKSSRGFCSELCIEKFYTPIINYFEEFDNKIREKHSASDENELIKLVGKIEFNDFFRNPDKIYRLSNELGDEYYTFICNREVEGVKTSIIAISFVYDYKPSFIFLFTATTSDEILSEFCQGELIESKDEFCQKFSSTDYSAENTDNIDNRLNSEIGVSKEMNEMLENKKSTLLAWLLENHSDTDISIEKFSEYEHFAKDTLEYPDEVFKWQDEEGDSIFTYLKGNELNESSFYYIVICTFYMDAKGINYAVPIISFPSSDPEIYNYFKKGEKMEGVLKS